MLGEESTVDQSVAQEVAKNPVIRGVFNEGFTLPHPILPPEMPVESGGRSRLIPVQTYDLEIQRGDGDQIIRGTVTIEADTHFLPNMATEQTSYTRNSVVLYPGGEEVDFIVVRRQDPKDVSSHLVAKQAPLVISVNTQSTFPRNGKSHDVQHFVSYKGRTFEGRKTSNNSDSSTPYNRWTEAGTPVNENGLIYLPYNNTVFDSLKVYIGDTPPQLPSQPTP